MRRSAFFGEFFDGITAVAEDAFVAVDIGNAADTGGGVVKGWVVTHHAEIVGVDFYLAEVHSADGAVGDGNFVGLAGAIVGDGDGFAGSGGVGGVFCFGGGEEREPCWTLSLFYFFTQSRMRGVGGKE